MRAILAIFPVTAILTGITISGYFAVEKFETDKKSAIQFRLLPSVNASNQ